MNAKRIAAVGVVLMISVGTAPAAPPPAATQPTTKPSAKPPEVLKDAVDPFNPAKERTRFFTAAGPDNELTKEEFAAGRGKADAFVRKFDTFEAMLAFDKNANKSVDWFEAKAYRRNLRERVLAEYDTNKDGKLTGGERDKANRALAAGRVPRGKAAARRTGLWGLDPETVAKHDADGDGQLSRDERRAMWRSRAEQQRQEVLEKYDADKDGTLGEAERKAFEEEMAERWRLRRFDRDNDGRLSEAEAAAAEEAEARNEKRRQEWARLQEEMLARHDADGNGRLEGDERQAAWRDMRGRWMSRSFDADGDGELSEREAASMKEAQAEMQATYDRWRADWIGKYDEDGDGELSREERQVAFRKEFQDLAESWRNQWDTDGDGQLSDEERRVMGDSLRKRGEELRKELDADGDGRVTGQEMRAFWTKLREVYDADKDGVLSPDEMKMMLRDQMRRMKPPAPGGP
jgi:Ca2+-binding EF-hand superfamily protein